MQRPQLSVTHVLAVTIALVMSASLILAGSRGGTPPPVAAPSPTPTPTEPEPSVSPTPSRTIRRPAPAKTVATRRSVPSVKPGRCGGVDADFNADGYADLVIGIPGEDVSEVADSGAINVRYGARSGLSDRTLVLTQDTPGIEESADEQDRFGDSLATGDFNGDGYTDLAVGVPGEVLTGFGDGAVNVIYGSRAGLRAAGDQVWHQGSPGVPEDPMSGEQFGRGLAAGDFNRDGYGDLAIGAPFEDLKRPGYLSAYGSAGAVTILFGSRAGIRSAGAQLVTQDSPGIPDDVEAVDLFGWAITSADVDRDGYCDIAVSSPGETIDGADHAGSLTVVHGSPEGIDTTRASLWHQNTAGVPDTAEQNDEFGRTMAAGDFDADGYADIAIGAHGEATAKGEAVGSVTVLRGTRNGLTAKGARAWSQDSPGIEDEAEGNEGFGLALVAEDFDGDNVEDLAVGVPYESFPPPVLGEPFTPGAVHVLFGVRGRGLTSARNAFWHQDSPGALDTSEHGDKFGLSVSGGDLNGDGIADLIIGAPGEDDDAGAVTVLFAGRSGLRTAGSRILRQGVDGVPGQPDNEDGFGSSTAAS